MNWLRYVLVLSLGAAGLLGSPDARAITFCSAEMTDLNFGSIDPNSPTVGEATIEYECTTLFGNNKDAIVEMCLAIGAGVTPGSTVTTRQMANNFEELLAFRLYKDPSRTQPWGDNPSSYLQLPTIEYPLAQTGFGDFGTTSGTVTVFGLIPAQPGVAASDYSNMFADTRLTYRYKDSPGQKPKSCETGGDTAFDDRFPFTARATVSGSCTVLTATEMDFSPGGRLYASSTGNLASTSTIALECTKRTAWQVGLDNGLHFDGLSRQMCVGSSPCIRYRLTNQTGQPWGNTPDVDTVPGSSTGIPQSLTVNGTVADQPLTLAGRYSDTIKVTLTY